MLTESSKTQLINDTVCCFVEKNSKVIKAERNGEDIKCELADVLLAADFLDTLFRYDPTGYFLYRQGCNYLANYSISANPPDTLLSITYLEYDGVTQSTLTLATPLAIASLYANLQSLVDELNGVGFGITLDDLVWVYNPVSGNGTMTINKSLKQPLHITSQDSLGDNFNDLFGAGTGCTLYITTQSAVDSTGTVINCGINVSQLTSLVKQSCGCCDVVGLSGCVNFVHQIGGGEGAAVTCAVTTTTTLWVAGAGNFICSTTANPNPIDWLWVLPCFLSTKLYFARITVANYSVGSLAVRFDGNLLHTITGNGTYNLYFLPTSGTGNLVITPTGFAGCVEVIVATDTSGWEVSNFGAWQHDYQTGCIIKDAGDPAETLTYLSTGKIVVGKTYRVTVSVIVTVGAIDVHVGGDTKNYTVSGTYTYDITATVADQLFFDPISVPNNVAVCKIEVCELQPGTAGIEETQFILGGGGSDTYIDANGNPILIT